MNAFVVRRGKVIRIKCYPTEKEAKRALAGIEGWLVSVSGRKLVKVTLYDRGRSGRPLYERGDGSVAYGRGFFTTQRAALSQLTKWSREELSVAKSELRIQERLHLKVERMSRKAKTSRNA